MTTSKPDNSSCTTPVAPEAAHATQSDHSLSRAPSSADEADDGRFSIAEEVNFDQQSDQARRIGQMPQELDAAMGSDALPSEATGAAPLADNTGRSGGGGIQADAGPASLPPSDSGSEAESQAAGPLRESIERAVPPSP